MLLFSLGFVAGGVVIGSLIWKYGKAAYIKLQAIHDKLEWDKAALERAKLVLEKEFAALKEKMK